LPPFLCRKTARLDESTDHRIVEKVEGLRQPPLMADRLCRLEQSNRTRREVFLSAESYHPEYSQAAAANSPAPTGFWE
jgi:hypothetical protein